MNRAHEFLFIATLVPSIEEHLSVLLLERILDTQRFVKIMNGVFVVDDVGSRIVQYLRP